MSLLIFAALDLTSYALSLVTKASNVHYLEFMQKQNAYLIKKANILIQLNNYQMAEYNIIKLEDYEEDDALWWCLHHKETLSYLKLRVTQYKKLKLQ